MKKILVIVDMQVGFINSAHTKEVADRTKGLLQMGLFDGVIMTRFINSDNSTYEKLLDWKEMKSGEAIDLVGNYREYADCVIDKSIYTCVNSDFLQKLCQLNGGNYPESVYIVGIDTDCCVLATALDLFEGNIRPIILADYCASSGGEAAHKAGLSCLKRLIGKNQLVYSTINSSDDLHV